MSPFRRVWRALTRSAAETSAHAQDPRLRGRTYAIPFDRVWSQALALTDGGLRRWRLLEADDHEGVIRAKAVAALLRSRATIIIRVVLDENAQTRVDAEAANVTDRADLGAGARHLGRFFRALDAAVATELRRTNSSAR